MKLILAVCLLLMLYINEEVNACKCAVLHPQKNFCDSEFVIRGKVLKAELVQGDRHKEKRYTVAVIRVFKGDKDAWRFVNVFIYTASSTAACGVYLDEGKEYIIGGGKAGSKWWINSCSGLREPWNTKNVCLKTNIITGRYRANCHCKLTRCIGHSNAKAVCQHSVKRYGQCVWVPCGPLYIHKSLKHA